MKNAISIRRLSFNYPDRAGVLNDISAEVAFGEKVGVIGPNGAGKTTLFHLLCGLHAPSSGAIVIDGVEVVPHSFNPSVGYVFQNPDDQLFNPTVFHDVAFGPLNMKLPREEIMLRVDEALEKTGCASLKERPPHHLSGGEKRMAAMASVLSMWPSIMIYDEPTSNLDIRSRRKVINLINSGDATSLIASHDLEFILETCGRVILIDGGVIRADGIPAVVMNNAGLMEAHGLERPHSLLHARKGHRHRG